MTGVINRFPAGLLSALDMKSRGQPPRELSGQVVGVYELGQLYELQRYVTTTANTSTSMTSPGFYGTSLLNVPENQIWRVLHISCQLTVAAATTYILAPAVRRRATTGGLLDFPLAPAQTYTATQVAAAAWQGSLWLNPGDGPSCHCVGVTLGTGGAAAIRITYVPYEI